MDDETTIWACQAIWKQKIPLKVKIFEWLLLRRSLVMEYSGKKCTQTHQKPREGGEYCKHLFFQCPFAHTIWASQVITSIEAIYETNFWDSIQRGRYRKKGKGGRILKVTWAILLHRNEVMFRGRLVSTNNVVHEIEGLTASWAHRVSYGDRGGNGLRGYNRD